MPEIAFRVDASLEIGTGHVMRCLTLADALRERGARCIFVCRPHRGHLLALVAQRGHHPLALPELRVDEAPSQDGTAHAHWLGTDWAADAHETQQALATHLGRKPVDWLVVDHYALDACWEEILALYAKRIMAIDDLADRSHACDVLMDQNLGRSTQDYDGLLKGNPTTLIGPKYALLRPEFAALRAQSLARRQSNPRLSRLLITMGGVDKDNATSQVLAALQSCNLPSNLRITVVMGPHAPWLKQVQEQAGQMPWHTEVLVGVNNIAQIMSSSDLAIGAAGGTAWERCTLGLFTILLVLAKNQLPGALALQEAGAALVMETRQEIVGFMALTQTTKFAKERLIKLSVAAAAVVDGEGCQRTVKFLLENAHD